MINLTELKENFKNLETKQREMRKEVKKLFGSDKIRLENKLVVLRIEIDRVDDLIWDLEA